MINNYIRKDLAGFTPYEPELGSYPIKLDANENPFVHNEGLLNKIKEFIMDSSNITRYPDTTSSLLKNKIAEYWQLKAENVVCGVGSDQIIDCMLKVLIEPGDKIVFPSPSFSMYKHSTVLNHGVPIEITLNQDNDYNYDLDEFIQVANKEKPKAIFLCSPNNPTGNVLDNDSIEYVLKNVKCPVVLDEAYAEFADTTSVALVNKYEHLVVLRTFSKAYGLAGLRVGYALGSKAMIDGIKLGMPPYNLNTISQYVGTLIIDQIDLYNKDIEFIINERKRLASELQTINNVEKVYPSEANFLLIKTNKSTLAKELKEKGILVRNFSSHPNMLNCIRVTIGTEEENNKLIEVLNTLLS
ncbi:histidinol phosphate aminotransferase [Natranaerovirga pectinivora]|uniref:Histidinol-phosphate aminotransferase n=1 Tax=Natranaerovirga pectinivora TaxID=682400 RepID=A0A4R3MP68_9FIRM|nr:histidinol-phosphate transaminase [Natranaerovirga pectinivora]TCT17021.1 histidinol phosphate aminotransferase [Natranaerovirga pectinivora]